MSKLQITPGTWTLADGPQYGYNKAMRVESEHGKFGTVICERFTSDTGGEVSKEYTDNLLLIADAGNTYQKDPTLPSDLLRQLSEANRLLRHIYDDEGSGLSVAMFAWLRDYIKELK